MKTHFLKVILLGAGLLVFTACSSVWMGGGRPGQGRGRYQSYKVLGIPPGHLPPPGECRVWYPGEPPGQQPPPQNCGAAFASAPPGTWVISGLPERKLKVTVYDSGKKRKVKNVSYYTID